jgi:TonB family protein
MKRVLRFVHFLLAALVILCSQLATVSQDQTPISKTPSCKEKGEIYHYKDLPKKSSKKAKIIKQPNPEYTSEARRNGIQGIVTLEAVFHCDGTIGEISVVKGLPDGLTEVSIEAARKIRFRPAMVGGQPVSVRMLVQYWFRLF